MEHSIIRGRKKSVPEHQSICLTLIYGSDEIAVVGLHVNILALAISPSIFPLWIHLCNSNNAFEPFPFVVSSPFWSLYWHNVASLCSMYTNPSEWRNGSWKRKQLCLTEKQREGSWKVMCHSFWWWLSVISCVWSSVPWGMTIRANASCCWDDDLSITLH